MMKCIGCGATMKTRRGQYRYAHVDGLHVILDGVQISKCAACGEEEVAIPHVEELNRALAVDMAQRPARLSGGQVRFLRKQLGWSGVDFARRVGVTPETVSRWESGTKHMSRPAELLLRLMTLQMRPVDSYPLPEELHDSGRRSARRVRARPSRGAWELTAQ